MICRYIVLLTIITALLAISGCTLNKSHYALASTKESGVFFIANSQTTQVAQSSTPEYKAGPEAQSTKLDGLLLGLSAPLDYKKYALVIGIEKYKQQANVNFATHSANTFMLAAKNVLGIPPENIISLIDDDATSGQIKAKIALLKELAEPGDSLYLFFAGHGVPGNDGNSYLLPSDMSADTIHLEPQLMLNNVYASLNNSAANRVYAFIDSCFSGKADSGELLFEGVAPVFKKQIKQFSSKKLTVMTAGGQNDFANQYKKESQRLFSYFLIRGLIEKKENVNELYDYVRQNVKKTSLRIGLGYKQIPQLQLAE